MIAPRDRCNELFISFVNRAEVNRRSLLRKRLCMKILFRNFSLAIISLMSITTFVSRLAAGQTTTTTTGAWTPSRTPDGQPDVQGFWNAEIGGTYSLVNPRRGGGRLNELLREKKGLDPVSKPSRVVDPPDGKIPYLPWAAAKQKDILEHVDEPTKPEYIDPQARCLPDGVIRSIYWSAYQILQFPGYVVIVYEQSHPYRVIPLDGRPHIGGNIKLWMGDSRGQWEGNTLVVDVTNNNSKSRLDNEGDFASDAVHIVERFRFVDAHTMEYEATLEDSSVYARPWKIAARMQRAYKNQPGYELWEDACHEGERDVDISLSSGAAQPGTKK
jgi:hypothetical protein